MTHEALCADLTCTALSPGELGDAIGAQNAAANLDLNALTVSVTGGGSVASTDKTYACGNQCYGLHAPGSIVTLNAKAASGSTFLAWGGACAGNALTCKVTVNAESTVTATFSAGGGGGVGGGGGGGGGGTFTLSVSHTNPGTVTGTPAGKDQAIDCGAACSAKFAPGTAVTLTAVPPAGKAFVNGSGACSGTTPTCTVTMSANTSAKAVFTK